MEGSNGGELYSTEEGSKWVSEHLGDRERRKRTDNVLVDDSPLIDVCSARPSYFTSFDIDGNEVVGPL